VLDLSAFGHESILTVGGQKQRARPEGRALDGTPEFLPSEVGSVQFLEVGPFFRKIVTGIDRGYRADWNASAAVDALNRIDEELLEGIAAGLIGLGVDAVHRAGIHTRPVFGADAGFRDYICHLKSLLESYVESNLCRRRF
jgi:hypothetical protein